MAIGSTQDFFGTTSFGINLSAEGRDEVGISDISRQAVDSALKEYDRLGRTAFLQKYEFSPAKSYFVTIGGRSYDSKAVLGAAHGFLAGQKPLRASEFSGGEATVARRLRQLGFQVENVGTKPERAVVQSIPFHVGQIYNRRSDIHGTYGGQQQGGIVTPSTSPLIFLFTGEAGEQHGYSDGWRSDGVFAYTGEGQRGDMEFVRGNRAIRDHARDGKDLLLFEASSSRGAYRYRGCFACIGWETGNGPDTEGAQRRTIVFLLAPEEAPPSELIEAAADIQPQRRLEELRILAEQAASATPIAGKDSRRLYYQRSAAVKTYVVARAKGRCEGCKSVAPFNRPSGEPYLEPHHLTRISDGGPDHPRHVIALCPNCHRRVHFGTDGPSFNNILKARMDEIEG